eukprot:COSAG03_NODE_2568_length_2635_cov_42.630521_1_plen_196_part_10
MRTAKAGPDDTALIMGAIEQLPGGVMGLNKLAMEQMRRWAFEKVGQMVSARRDDAGRVSQVERELGELRQLGWFMYRLGEMDAARKLYEEVIEGQTAQLGASHTRTLVTKSNLADLQMEMGEMDAARKLYEEVIEGKTAQLGASHTSTLVTKSNLATLQKKMGEMDAARKLYEEVIEGQTAQLGASHTSTLVTKSN